MRPLREAASVAVESPLLKRDKVNRLLRIPHGDQMRVEGAALYLAAEKMAVSATTEAGFVVAKA